MTRKYPVLAVVVIVSLSNAVFGDDLWPHFAGLESSDGNIGVQGTSPPLPASWGDFSSVTDVDHAEVPASSPLVSWLTAAREMDDIPEVAREIGTLASSPSVTAEIAGWAFATDEVPKTFEEALQPKYQPRPGASSLALRTGWWAVDSQGSKTKTGEFQSLESSPFWDVDRLWSDGERTLDFTGTGFDQEGNQGSIRWFGPRGSVKVDYQRFLRRLDHSPLSGFTNFQQQTPGGDLVITEDLNTGEDYAIRVQELKVKFKGKLTKNINWRLNVWGMRKKGERQVNSFGHCFNHPNDSDINGNPVGGISCHILSQRQQIDWLTSEIKPVIEGRFGRLTVEYSRTMRTLTTDDQRTTRPYDNFGFNGDLPYAVVAENYTEIDRLKIGLRPTKYLDFYSSLFLGNTKNQSRDTNRRFGGYDFRLTDRSIDGLSLTVYSTQFTEKGSRPTVLLAQESPADIRGPVNYERTTAGTRARWRPFRNNYGVLGGLRLSGGYEYRELDRGNAVYQETVVTADQSHTAANRINLRAAMRWADPWESHVRYRLAYIDNPLFGVPVKNATVNSSLPTQENLIEIGTTWTPADNFLLSITLGLENRRQASDVARFDEDNYPIVLTGWYAPTPKWSVSGGVASYSNWIDQDITLGSKSTPSTSQWSYGGRADTVNFATTYAWTERLNLTGGLEYTRGRNTFQSPTLWPDLAQYSNVIVETMRWTAGIDYQLREGISGYFRYQFFDYQDKSEPFNSGTANMFLAGVSGVY